MATIPVGNFGRLIAEPSRSPSIDPAAFGAGVGQGMRAAGAEISAAAEREQVERDREQARIKQERESLARAKAANNLLDYEIQLSNVQTDIQARISAGELDYNKAPDEYKKRANELQAPKVDYLDPVGQENYNKGITRVQFRGEQVVNGLVEVKRKDDAKNQFAIGLDGLGKLAGLPGANVDEINGRADYLRENAITSGLDASAVDRALQNFKDNNWYNQATQKAMQNRNNLGGLKQLEQDLTSEKGYYANKLDPEKRNVVLRQVMNNRMQLEEKAERQAAARDAKAGNALVTLTQLVSTGMPVSADAWKQYGAIVSGTSYSKPFQELMQQEQKIQSVLRMPIAQQQAYITQERARLERDGISSTADVTNFNRLQSAFNSNMKMLRTDPLAFDAVRTGTQHSPLDLANLGSPQNAEAFSERISALASMRAKYGETVPIKPLLDAEAQALTTALQNSSPQQAVAILGTLQKSINNDKAFKAAVQQMAKDNPLLLSAGIAHASDFRTPSGRAVAPLILDGANVRKDKSVLLPKDKAGQDALQPVFNQYVGSAIPPGPAREASYQTYLSIYAGLAKETGQLDGMLDTGLAKQAAQLATGGVVEYNDRPTLTPYGMDEDTFHDNVRSQVRGVAQTIGLKPKALDDLPLIYAGDGKYFIGSGAEIVRDKRGAPIRIDPQNPLPEQAPSPETVDKAKQTSIMMRGF